MYLLNNLPMGNAASHLDKSCYELMKTMNIKPYVSNAATPNRTFLFVISGLDHCNCNSLILTSGY